MTDGPRAAAVCLKILISNLHSGLAVHTEPIWWHQQGHAVLTCGERDAEFYTSMYPKTWAYLRKFEKLLKVRKAFLKFFDPGRDLFYSMYSVSEQTFMPHKVVWMDISSTMKATVVSSYDDKLPIPEHTTMFVTVKSADEAYYLAAVLNSRPASTAVAGYIVDNHVSTHPCENIILPKFEKSSALHRTLVALSKRAHEAATTGDASAVSAIEAEINDAVKTLW